MTTNAAVWRPGRNGSVADFWPVAGMASETDRAEVRRNGTSFPGRPRTAGKIEALVVRMANRDWG